MDYLGLGLLIVIIIILTIGFFKMRKENEDLKDELADEKKAFNNLFNQSKKN